jgi:hypothetical protein
MQLAFEVKCDPTTVMHIFSLVDHDHIHVILATTQRDSAEASASKIENFFPNTVSVSVMPSSLERSKGNQSKFPVCSRGSQCPKFVSHRKHKGQTPQREYFPSVSLEQCASTQ